jgi:hypothetical protein
MEHWDCMMLSMLMNLYCFFWLLVLPSLESAMGIDCYQCSSSESIYCSDNMIQDGILTATTCDHVFEASYCIKTVGLYGGTSFMFCIVCACACL